MYKFERGDLITLVGLYSLSQEEMYKSNQLFPSFLEFIGIVIHVVPPAKGGWHRVGYNVYWLGDTGLSNHTIFFDEELELIVGAKE
jgi:hypothetical protein